MKSNSIVVKLGTIIRDVEGSLPFIFDPFHRVEKSQSRKIGGTGLGLAIVLEIVKLLQGSIEVKSEYGKGTEFLLKLPLKNTEKSI